jgi:hypothetical protein
VGFSLSWSVGACQYLLSGLATSPTLFIYNPPSGTKVLTLFTMKFMKGFLGVLGVLALLTAFKVIKNMITWEPGATNHYAYNVPTQPPLYSGKKGYFSIDSIIESIKGDTTFTIDGQNFDKSDSILYISIIPRFSYLDSFAIMRHLGDSLIAKYDVRYSTNISGIAFVKSFPNDSLASKTFHPLCILYAGKPGAKGFDKNFIIQKGKSKIFKIH